MSVESIRNERKGINKVERLDQRGLSDVLGGEEGRRA